MIYLDNPATTFPKPPSLAEEISRCIKCYCGNPGRSTHFMSMKSAERIFETRSIIADMFSCEPENVIFTYNTTYALNIAIKSSLKPHSHILLSDIEHNAVLRPVSALSRDGLCSYDFFCTDGTNEDILNSIRQKITDDTSMLICSHISNVGERRLPIKEIGELCRERGIFFIVDGAQSAGIHEISTTEMNIDALCFPAHKALYGPQGVGVLILNSEKSRRTIIEGGTGVASLSLEMPDFLPERYEAGTLSTPLIAGFGESLKWLRGYNMNKIREHEEVLYNTALDLLRKNEQITVYKMNEYSGNTLMFNVKGISCAKIGYELNRRDICVRTGFHCAPLAHKKLKTGDFGAVRIGFSLFNTQKEVYSFYDALIDILKKQIIA